MAVNECPDHPKLMINSLMSLKNGRHFCDATVIAGDEKIQVHRLVLMAASQYFKAIFLEKDAKSTAEIVELHDIPGGIAKQCIEFIYSGKATFSSENMASFFKASNTLCLHNLTELYVKFLAGNINVNNVIEMLSLVKMYSNTTKLKDSVQEFLFTNFDAVIESKKYLSLDSDCFIYMLSLVGSDDDLEEVRLNAMLNWIKYDIKNRKDRLVRLINLIDFSLLSKDFIQQELMMEPLVLSSIECLQLISGFLLQGKFKRKRIHGECQPPDVSGMSVKKRRTVNSVKHLRQVVICTASTRVIYRGDLKNDCWSKITVLPESIDISYLYIIEHQGSIYVGNGGVLSCFDGWKWMNLWKRPYESHERGFVICVASGQYVFMLTPPLAVMYDTSIAKSQTANISYYHGAQFFAACSATDVYIMGGVDSRGANTNRVSVLSIKGLSFKSLMPMKFERSSGSGVWYNDTLYALGGGHKEVEFYNDITRQWQIIRNLEIECVGWKVHIADKLYMYKLEGMLQTKVRTVELEKLKISDEDKQPSSENIGFGGGNVVYCGSFS